MPRVTVNHHVRIDPQLREEIERYADEEGLTINEATERLILAGIDAEKKRARR